MTPKRTKERLVCGLCICLVRKSCGERGFEVEWVTYRGDIFKPHKHHCKYFTKLEGAIAFVQKKLREDMNIRTIETLHDR